MSNTSEPLHPQSPNPSNSISDALTHHPSQSFGLGSSLHHDIPGCFDYIQCILLTVGVSWGPIDHWAFSFKRGCEGRVWLYMCNTIDLQLCSSVFQLLRKSVATCATPWVHEATLLLQGFGVWHWWPLGPLNFPLLQLNEEKLDVTSKICWVKLVASLAALKWNCEKH